MSTITRYLALVFTIMLIMTACTTNRQQISQQTKASLKSAYGFYKKNNFQQAEPLYLTVLEDNPDNLIALRRLGDITLSKSDQYAERSVEFYEGAYVLYNRAITITQTFNNLSKDEKISLLEMQTLRELCWKRIVIAGEDKMKQQDSIAALEIFKKANNLDPNRTELVNYLLDIDYKLGKAYYKKGMWDLAKTNLESALSKEPERVTVLTMLIDVYKKNNLPLRRAELMEKLALINADENIMCDAGNIYKEQGNIKNAELAYRSAIKLKSDFYRANVSLTNLLYDNNQIELALEQLNFAEMLNDTDLNDLIATYEYSERKSLFGKLIKFKLNNIENNLQNLSISELENAINIACAYGNDKQKTQFVLQKKLVEQRIADEKLAEEIRIKAEQIAEIERLREEKLAEEKRLAEKKQLHAKAYKKIQGKYWGNELYMEPGYYIIVRSDGKFSHFCPDVPFLGRVLKSHTDTGYLEIDSINDSSITGTAHVTKGYGNSVPFRIVGNHFYWNGLDHCK